MDVTTAVRMRRMCRRFDPSRGVPDEVVDELLDLATRAPSAGHTQGWEFVVLSDPGDRGHYWDATRGPEGPPDRWLRGVQAAPVLVLVLSDPDAYLDRYAAPDKGWTDRSLDRWPVPYWDTDSAMAAMILLLAAEERHLGSLFFGVPGPAHSSVRSAFSIPERLRIVGVVALGHPDPDSPTPRSPSLRRGRRRLADVVHRGRFGPV
ncbi:MAG: nitroreductase family protein [Dermatophilaceae bacterium]|nr:nitroreductase family protein [Intrasporangiaceae bacterium]